MEGTKTMILESLGVTMDSQKGWISTSMAIENMDNTPLIGNKSAEDSMHVSNIDGSVPGYTSTVDGKGIKLKQVLRAGEGPAHCNEQWSTIVVPQWAVGKAYFFEVNNDSPLNLSCELFLDGEKVAFNAPIPPTIALQHHTDSDETMNQSLHHLNPSSRTSQLIRPEEIRRK